MSQKRALRLPLVIALIFLIPILAAIFDFLVVRRASFVTSRTFGDVAPIVLLAGLALTALSLYLVYRRAPSFRPAVCVLWIGMAVLFISISRVIILGSEDWISAVMVRVGTGVDMLSSIFFIIGGFRSGKRLE